MKNFDDDSTYYHYKLIINSKITTKVRIYLLLLFFSILILSVLTLIQLYTFYPIPSLKTEILFLQILLGFFLAPIFHHFMHGIAYIVLGILPSIQLQLTVGIPMPKNYTEKMVLKRNYIFILLTPLILGTGILASLLIFTPSIWYLCATMLSINLALGFADTYWVKQLQGMHPAVVIRSSKYGFNVYKV